MVLPVYTDMRWVIQGKMINFINLILLNYRDDIDLNPCSWKLYPAIQSYKIKPFKLELIVYRWGYKSTLTVLAKHPSFA